MRKYLTLFLTSGAFIMLLCSLSVIWYIREKPKVYNPNPIRPEDFPEILIAHENAVLVDYAAPPDCVPHTYQLSFVVPEPYPSDDTYKFIDNHLSSNGWQRLNYDLLNPYSPTTQARTVPERLDPQTVNMLFPERKQRGDHLGMWRKEDWVKDDVWISVILSYAADLATKEVNRDKVYVNLSFSGRESGILSIILRYKELHTGEFENK